MTALTSGAAQGLADSASDAVKSAYSKLKQLVKAKLADNRSAEVALAEHANDPETWQTPLAKVLSSSGAINDPAVIEAAQLLMTLLDPAGSAKGTYQIDLRGAQGVQVGDGNQMFNTLNAPTFVMPPSAEVRPGQPRNEAAFDPAYEAAGGRWRLGRALDQVYEDGPGWVQQFDGGSTGRSSVICALFGQSAVAVDQEVWNALSQFGRGTYVGGVAAVGFPVPSSERPFIATAGGRLSWPEASGAEDAWCRSPQATGDGSRRSLSTAPPPGIRTTGLLAAVRWTCGCGLRPGCSWWPKTCESPRRADNRCSLSCRQPD